MDDQIIIRDFTESITHDYKEVSTEVDGDRVFFRVPSHFELNHRAEPFLGIALLEAMIRNVDIRIENSLPLSERLYKVLPELQSIYSCWNSDLPSILSMPADDISYQVTVDGTVPPFTRTVFSITVLLIQPLSMRYVRFEATCCCVN